MPSIDTDLFWAGVEGAPIYTYALTGDIDFSGLFAHVSGSPMLFMNLFGTSEQEHGWIFAFLSVGFIGSSQVNTLLLRRYRSESIVLIALMIALVFLAIALSGWLTLPITLGFLLAFLCCIGFTNPNAAALSLAPFTRNGGSASALLGTLQMGMGTLIAVLMSLFEVPSAVPMVLAGSSLLALVVLVVGRRLIPAGVGVDPDPAAVALH